MVKQKLVLLLDINEDELRPGAGYSELPDALDAAVSKVASVELGAVYLLNPKADAETLLNGVAVNYHHHAVSVRGEKCTEDNCEQHPTTNVIFHDHANRNNGATGLN